MLKNIKNRIDGKNGKNEQKQKLRDSEKRDLNEEKSFSRTASPSLFGSWRGRRGGGHARPWRGCWR